jgi:hypothetical protein
MTINELLQSWTGPSSDSEKDKQDRTIRMVREAIDAHPAFAGCDLLVYSKGSYPNNTNVKSDSDVDVGVQCREATYWEEAKPGVHPEPSSSYTGIWTPSKLRSELEAALKEKFGDQVDMSGSTAIRVNSSSARVDADVVPCFSYRYYFEKGGNREGAKTFRRTGNPVVNYPVQHLENGRRKNTDTNSFFKQAVRVMKRLENVMVESNYHPEVPSYFIECLVYNCPDSVFLESTWTKTLKAVLVHIWNQLEGDEPTVASSRWLEVNGCKWLFGGGQKWTREDGRAFSKAAWNYLGFAG